MTYLLFREEGDCWIFIVKECRDMFTKTINNVNIAAIIFPVILQHTALTWSVLINSVINFLGIIHCHVDNISDALSIDDIISYLIKSITEWSKERPRPGQWQNHNDLEESPVAC